MSNMQLTLEKRTVTGKKLGALRAAGQIPSVIYGGSKEPILAASEYNATEKTLRVAGYHSTIDLDVAGKKQLAIVKNIDIDPVSRRIINIEFQAVSANEVVEATAPIIISGYDGSEANKLHYTLLQVMEEIDVKAKPSELPSELTIDASGLATLDDKLTVSDIQLPKGVALADKELSLEQVVASLHDPAAEAAAREAEEAAAPAEESAPAEAAAEEKAE